MLIMANEFKAVYKHDNASPATGLPTFAVEVKHWGYVETLYVEAETKFLALIKAREMRKGLECSLSAPREEKR